MSFENGRSVANRSGRVAHLVERQEMSAEQVFEKIKPEEPPPPDDPPPDDGDGGSGPERQEFSAAAVAISLLFMAGGVYLFVVGFRATRRELSLLKGGKK